MKKIGEYTVQGRGDEPGSPFRIRLFDGRYDTAYKVVSFNVFQYDISGTYDARCSGKLATTDESSTSSVDFWDASDQRQIAWASSYDGAIDAGGRFDTIVNPENLIVEDLWVYLRSNQNEPVNYIITFEKYELGDLIGPTLMIQNRSQG